MQYALFPAEFTYAFYTVFWDNSLNNFVCVLYPFFIYAWAFGFWNMNFFSTIWNGGNKKDMDLGGNGWLEREQMGSGQEKNQRYKCGRNEFIYMLKDGLYRAFETTYICAFLPVKFMKVPEISYFLNPPPGNYMPHVF